MCYSVDCVFPPYDGIVMSDKYYVMIFLNNDDIIMYDIYYWAKGRDYDIGWILGYVLSFYGKSL